MVADRRGRVFIANGQIFVHGPDGRELGRIDVPERPLQLLVGGERQRTLFILATMRFTGLSSKDRFAAALVETAE